MDKTGILPWNPHRERDGDFSWRQALAEGSSIFIFMLAVPVAFGEATMRLSAVILAATVGFLYGVYGGWYSSAKPIS
jgi:hypothetical protein